MDSEKQSEGFEGGGRLGEPGGGYWRGHGLHGALGVVLKQYSYIEKIKSFLKKKMYVHTKSCTQSFHHFLCNCKI